MRAYLVIALISLGLSVAAPAAEGDAVLPLASGVDAIVVPQDGPLVFERFVDRDTARFRGRFLLAGTWYYGDRGMADDPVATLELNFVPDAAVAKHLPHWRDRGGPSRILITNGAAFAGDAVGKETIAALVKHRERKVSGRAAIWVDRFEATIQCDTPLYSARFLAVAHTGLAQTGKAEQDFGC